ncbi:hypothetical protein [Nocardioides sp. SYSU DS0651]|uniref:hypothetical protein n=1 Tax=Nocardioides sp. SYSU DS0651 TaxID=3415955 RepID=UPI003F4B7C4A
MTETPEHDEPLTPRQEAAVRRALAQAGGSEPMPEEVADRLDRVIAGLAADRGTVVAMDAAAIRRRTRVRWLLGAAAAVVAVAVGVGVVTDNGSGADSMAASEQLAEDDPSRSGTSQAELAESGEPSELAGGGEAMDDAAAPDNGMVVGSRRVVTRKPLRAVRPDRLRADLVAVQRASLPRSVDYGRSTLTAPKGFMCEQGAYGRGYLVGVEYDGGPALVAFREPMGSTQVAEVLACGTGYVLHSTTLNVAD